MHCTVTENSYPTKFEQSFYIIFYQESTNFPKLSLVLKICPPFAYLKSSHVSWVSGIFQTILVALHEEFEEVSEKTEMPELVKKKNVEEIAGEGAITKHQRSLEHAIAEIRNLNKQKTES